MDKLTIKQYYSERIFQHIANQLGTKFLTNRHVKAWFRTERTPSAKFSCKQGEYLYTDFGSGESLDCIGMWQKAFNTDFKTATNQIADFFNIGDSPTPHYTPPPPAPEPQTVYLSSTEMEQSCNVGYYPNNNLFTWLATIVGEDVATEQMQRYNVGTSNKTFFGAGATVFWFMDKVGTRYAKIVQYSSKDGKRNRESDYPFLQPKHHQHKGLTPCLFGEHLIQTAPSEQIICIVESEKTAVLCSVFCPSFLWLASGGTNGLTAKKTESLKGRTVYLITDSDTEGRVAYLKASEILTKQGIQNKVLDLFPDRCDKSDFCDYIVTELQKLNTPPQPPQPPQTVQNNAIPPTASNNTIPTELTENQAFNKLLNTFDLEIINITKAR